MESKEISVKRGSCEVSGQKSKFSYRHAELRAVKVKKKKTRDVQACSLFSLNSLFSGKGNRKTHSSFSLFTATGARVRSLMGN